MQAKHAVQRRVESDEGSSRERRERNFAHETDADVASSLLRAATSQLPCCILIIAFAAPFSFARRVKKSHADYSALSTPFFSL